MIAQTKGKLVSCQPSEDGKWEVLFKTEQPLPLQIEEDLQISLEKWREKRSLDQNSMLWSFIDQIAEKVQSDRWSIYLQMLKDYGKASYLVVNEKALDYLKATIRETEVLGEIEVNGRRAIQVACYHGSSTLNTKEFSRLLDGVLSEARNLGIEVPEQERLRILSEQNLETH